MKKTYIIPQTKTVTIAACSIICGSITSTDGVDGLGVSGTTSEHNVTTAGVKGDQYSVWDDDWSK